jgi:hypothetical protein
MWYQEKSGNPGSNLATFFSSSAGILRPAVDLLASSLSCAALQRKLSDPETRVSRRSGINFGAGGLDQVEVFTSISVKLSHFFRTATFEMIFLF